MDLDPLNRLANNPVDAHINDCEGEFSKTKKTNPSSLPNFNQSLNSNDKLILIKLRKRNLTWKHMKLTNGSNNVEFFLI